MRYFLFNYTFDVGHSKYGLGNCALSCPTFPEESKLEQLIIERKGYKKRTDLIILGWNEFNNQQDYYNYLGKR